MVIHYPKLFNVEAYRITKDGELDRCVFSEDASGNNVYNKYIVDTDKITHTIVFLDNRIVCLWDNRACQFDKEKNQNFLWGPFLREMISKQAKNFTAYFKEFEYF